MGIHDNKVLLSQVLWVECTMAIDGDRWRVIDPHDIPGAETLLDDAADFATRWRLINIATFADAVYVLHAFQKKTRQTTKRKIGLAALRLREHLARSR